MYINGCSYKHISNLAFAIKLIPIDPGRNAHQHRQYNKYANRADNKGVVLQLHQEIHKSIEQGQHATKSHAYLTIFGDAKDKRSNKPDCRHSR